MALRTAAALLAITGAGAAACTTIGSSPEASPPSSAAISITGAWARPSLGMADAIAAYLVLANPGSVSDALVGVASDVASTVQLHQTVAVEASTAASAGMAMGSPSSSGGMMAMLPLARIEIPAGGTVELRAGGYHIMLTGLKRQVKAGDTFTLTLTFERAGPIPVTVVVRDS